MDLTTGNRDRAGRVCAAQDYSRRGDEAGVSPPEKIQFVLFYVEKCISNKFPSTLLFCSLGTAKRELSSAV